MWLPAATFLVVVVILRGVQPASTFQRWVFGLGLEYILIYVYTAKLYTNGYTIPSLSRRVVPSSSLTVEKMRNFRNELNNDGKSLLMDRFEMGEKRAYIILHSSLALKALD